MRDLIEEVEAAIDAAVTVGRTVVIPVEAWQRLTTMANTYRAYEADAIVRHETAREHALADAEWLVVR